LPISKIVEDADLLVVGGGPAGLGAAIEAGRRGARVLVADEHDRPGGQLFKQIHKFFGSHAHYAGSRGFEIGNRLIIDARDAGVTVLLSTKVLGIFPDHRVSLLTDGQKVVTIKPRALVLATGGGERGASFPGWTLPGVITAGAAQTFCNIHRVLPGKRVVMMGSGNVGLIVAYQLLQAGTDVIALVEAKEEIGGYQVHGAKILRAGVPIYTGHTVKEARGNTHVEEVVIAAVDTACNEIPGTEKSFQADTLCLAVGLTSDQRLATMAGCRLCFSPEFGGTIPWHDKDLETSIPGIFVAGDCAGIEEANTALDEGRIAGIGAACALGTISEAEREAATAEIWDRLNDLRSGSFGIRRRMGKERIMRSGYGQEISCSDCGASGTVTDNTDKVPAESCPDSFLIGDDHPPVGKGKKPVAVFYCDQDIPCNPCISACPVGAITMTPSLTGTPRLDSDLCTGCGRCLSVCPGQAIVLFLEEYGQSLSTLTFVYEYLPLPQKGERVRAVDRFGSVVCNAEVIRVSQTQQQNRSPLVTIAYDRSYAGRVRFIERKREEM